MRCIYLTNWILIVVISMQYFGNHDPWSLVKDTLGLYSIKLAVMRPLLLPNCEGSHSVRLLRILEENKIPDPLILVPDFQEFYRLRF